MSSGPQSQRLVEVVGHLAPPLARLDDAFDAAGPQVSRQIGHAHDRAQPDHVRNAADVLHGFQIEAAVLGIRAISEEWSEEPGLATRIEVQVKAPAVTHEVTFKQLRDWLDGTCKSPKDRIVKDRLKSLLPS